MRMRVRVAEAGRRCRSEPRHIARRTRGMVYVNHTDFISLESVSNGGLCVRSPPMRAGRAVKRVAPLWSPRPPQSGNTRRDAPGG